MIINKSNPILPIEGKVITKVLKIILNDDALVTNLNILPSRNTLKTEV